MELHDQRSSAGTSKSRAKRKLHTGWLTAVIIWTVPCALGFGWMLYFWVDAMTTYYEYGWGSGIYVFFAVLIAGLWLGGVVVITLLWILVSAVVRSIRGGR